MFKATTLYMVWITTLFFSIFTGYIFGFRVGVETEQRKLVLCSQHPDECRIAGVQ